jgi:hypothetical protein
LAGGVGCPAGCKGAGAAVRAVHELGGTCTGRGASVRREDGPTSRCRVAGHDLARFQFVQGQAPFAGAVFPVVSNRGRKR